MRFWKLLLPLLASTLALAAQPDRIVRPIDATQTVMLAGHVAPQALPQYDQGPVEPSFQMSVTMLLTPTAAQEQALEELLAEQQDHHSPSFHKWLTPEQFADRFSVSQEDMDKVNAWLTSQGLTVTYTARGREFITFSGDAAHVQNVFKTQIHRYNVNGEKHFANAAPPMIPASLNGIVGGFRGLHDFVPRPYIKPHANFSDPNFSTHFLAPGDIATIYNINPLYQSTPAIDGTGQKMVIVGQTDIYLADINDFRGGFNLPTIPTSGSGKCTTNSSGVVTSPCNTTNFQFVIPTGQGDPGISLGDVPESDLDIEWSGAVARNAQIIFVTSPIGSGGVDTSASFAIDNNLAPVISMSYGLCEALETAPRIATADLEYKKAAMEGISFFTSSGDTGAATCEAATGKADATLGLSVSYPASSIWVTAVGGTEFNEGAGDFWNAGNGTDGGSAKSYIPELAWNDSALVGGPDGGGGGPSNCVNGSGTKAVALLGGTFSMEICDAPTAGGFAKPSWQVGITPNDSVRDVPDVSFAASNANDPYIVCTPQEEIGGSGSTSACSAGISAALDDFPFPSAFGGTSVSSPVMAGITVLLNQFLGSAASGGLGNVSPELYALFVSNPTDFHDIVAGFNANTGNNSDNIVSCSGATPSFEPVALQCPGASGTIGSFGFAAGSGYDLATGLGSFNVNNLFNDWAAATGGTFTLAAAPTTITATAGHNSTTTTITITPQNGFTSSVTFSCTGLPTGASCSFSPPSDTAQTVLTVLTVPNMGPTVTVTVKGTAGSVSSTTPVTLNLNPTDETVTLATTPLNLTLMLSPGATSNNTANLTVGGTNGFIVTNGGTQTTVVPLTYTCTLTPAASEGPTCSVSGGVQAIAVTATVLTTAPTVELRSPFAHGSRIFYAMLLPGLFGIVFAAGSGKRGARLLSLIVVLGASTLWMGACGSSGGSSGGTKNPGTPPGTYTATVTANTSPASTVTASTTFTVVVQ